MKARYDLIKNFFENNNGLYFFSAIRCCNHKFEAAFGRYPEGGEARYIEDLATKYCL